VGVLFMNSRISAADFLKWHGDGGRQKEWKGCNKMAEGLEGGQCLGYLEDVILHGMRPSCNMGEFVPSFMARLVESDHIL